MGKTSVIFFMVLTMLFWGINFHAAKIALQFYGPMSVAAIRFFFAVIVLFGILFIINRNRKLSFPFSKKDAWYIFLTSFFGIFLSVYFFNSGLMTTSAVNSSLIIATSPIITAIFAFFFLNKKLILIQWAATFISFFGVAVLLVKGDLSQLVNLKIEQGDFYILMMAIAFSISQIIVSKHLGHIPSLTMTAFTSLIGLILFIFSSFPELSMTPLPSAFSFWASILFMGILGTGIGYTIFFLSVVRLGASTSALYINLVPFFAVLTAFPFGETVYAAQLLGGLIIIAGLLIFGFASKQVTAHEVKVLLARENMNL